MVENFEKYLRERAELTPSEIEIVRSVSLEKKIKRRQYLLHAGEICHYNTFISEGCLRLFRVGEDGTEHILRFGIQNWWISDHESYNTGNPSKSHIDALEDSTVFRIDKPDFARLMATIPAFHAFVERLKERSFDASQNRIFSNISYTAEQKYEYFLKLFPDIFARVPLHMIASYLGVSRETLTRVRSHSIHKNL
jgi:CRP-like cAMP-binding protein